MVPPLLLLLLFGLTLSQVTPSFSCWFSTYNGSARITNLVYSYNNSLTADVIIPVDALGGNTLTPLGFNGQQPDIFKAGFNTFALVLTDSAGTISRGGFIVWQLGNTTLRTEPQHITNASRCDTAYNGSCPSGWPDQALDHFCEDASFCNGQEGCFSLSLFGTLTTRTMGVCAGSQFGVSCPVGQRCGEDPPACFTVTAPPTPEIVRVVTPLFYCWFATNDTSEGRVISVALGYNNTAGVLLSRPLTLPTNTTTANFIQPSLYHGLQTTLFQVGYDALSFVLRDSGRVLLTGGNITWRLTVDTLTITLAQHIVPSAECSLVSSPGDSEDIVPPTTEAPTEEPTPEPGDCNTTFTDCTAFDTFCHGAYVCNTTLQECVSVDALFSPCTASQAQVTMGAPVVLICVEHLQLCVAYVNCTTDQECQDGLLCNGRERCDNGTCYGANLTLAELCGTENAICIEGQGCSAINQAFDPKLVVALVAAASFVAIIVLVLVCYFFYTYRAAPKAKKK
jgi:hypothetical protein